MKRVPKNTRKSLVDTDPIFADRWSPRAFSAKSVPEGVLWTLFEAARWAPSSYNEQPWLFLYAADEENLAVYRGLLTEQNRIWAEKAPVLAFVLAKRKLDMTGQENFTALFDAGAAWMSLALQARKMELFAHAMGGILRDKVYDTLGVPRQDYIVVCGIAIGYYGDPSQLPDDLRSRETPTDRKPLEQVARSGKF